MKRAAYVVLSHSLPEQVGRLARAVHRSSPNAEVVVYHDARMSPPPVAAGPWMQVYSHTLQADWGSWELAAASMTALDLARSRTDAQILVLISGQDYPAVRLVDWERRFLELGGWQGEAKTLRYEPRWGRSQGRGDDDLTRYSHIWWPLPWSRRLSVDPSRLATFARHTLYRIGHYAEPWIDVRNLPRGRGMYIGFRNPASPFKSGIECKKGSQWLAVETALFRSVMGIHRSTSWLKWSYRHSIVPDESYLQTILAALRTPQAAPPLSYLEWSVALDRPRTLTVQDLETVLRSGSPFCRKVEPGPSDELMDALDARSRAVHGEAWIGATSRSEEPREPTTR